MNQSQGIFLHPGTHGQDLGVSAELQVVNRCNSGGATDTPGYTSNQSSNTSSQDKSSLARTNSTPSFNHARTNLNPNAAEFIPKAYKPATTGMNGNLWDDQKALALSVNGENEVTI